MHLENLHNFQEKRGLEIAPFSLKTFGCHAVHSPPQGEKFENWGAKNAKSLVKICILSAPEVCSPGLAWPGRAWVVSWGGLHLLVGVRSEKFLCQFARWLCGRLQIVPLAPPVKESVGTARHGSVKNSFLHSSCRPAIPPRDGGLLPWPGLAGLGPGLGWGLIKT